MASAVVSCLPFPYLLSFFLFALRCQNSSLQFRVIIMFFLFHEAGFLANARMLPPQLTSVMRSNFVENWLLLICLFCFPRGFKAWQTIPHHNYHFFSRFPMRYKPKKSEAATLKRCLVSSFNELSYCNEKI